MSRAAVLLFIGSLLAGCASVGEAYEMSKTGTDKSIAGPDGTPHELIKCFDVEKCYSKAAASCSGKYQIIDDSTSYHDKDLSSVTTLLVKCAPKG